VNYRHAFHAGNFADLVKHAILLELLARRASGAPLTVVDTHAGAGMYDLGDEASRRSGEAEAGIVRLMADAAAPAVFDRLKAAVTVANPDGVLRLYPGSPALALGALERRDRYVGCELRRDDHASLARVTAEISREKGPMVEALNRDGYGEAARLAQSSAGPMLVFVDPPFEHGDDYARVVALAAASRRRRDTGLAIWTPLKDLETFDRLLRELEALDLASIQVAECRLRALDDPMRMNGCAMVLVNLPDIGEAAQAICSWVADALGEPGGEARVYAL
jgi:23S rRNA (adenine2030-N6)-methyltransferase